MPEVEFMILAEHAVIENDKVFMLGGCFTGLLVPAFPYETGLIYFVILLRVPIEEIGNHVQLGLALADDMGTLPHYTLAEKEVILSRDAFSETGRTTYQRLSGSFLPITFTRPGAFELVLSLDGVEKQRVPFRVAKDPLLGATDSLLH